MKTRDLQHGDHIRLTAEVPNKMWANTSGIAERPGIDRRWAMRIDDGRLVTINLDLDDDVPWLIRDEVIIEESPLP